jgi:proprotein convertase subtilisin/kexin type 5
MHLIDRNSIIGWQSQCLLPCMACQPINSAICTSCYSNTSITSRTLLLKDNNTCVSLCGDYRYFNVASNACENCSTLCGNCENSSSTCLDCPTNRYLFNNKCNPTCPNGYFPYISSCIACTSTLKCYTCSN